MERQPNGDKSELEPKTAAERSLEEATENIDAHPVSPETAGRIPSNVPLSNEEIQQLYEETAG